VDRFALLLLRTRTRGRVTIDRTVALGRGVRLEATGAGRIVVGQGCVLGDGTRIEARGGTVLIGAGTRTGEGCIICAHERISVGTRARLGDEVVVQDATRRSDDPERPVREQGLRASAVTIGEGVTLGARAVVEPGASVGDGAIVEPGSVVIGTVPAAATVIGIPARPAVAPRRHGRGPH
jgi:acetyltransferase-like isoleucine patch superfamily enzyme